MRDLVIMPAMAQRRESLNMGEFAEEAIIVEEVAAPKRVNHFIEANTQEVTLQHLQQDCIIPSFASMEETISHQSFIGAVVDAAKDYFMENSLICQRLESHTLSMAEYQVH